MFFGQTFIIEQTSFLFDQEGILFISFKFGQRRRPTEIVGKFEHDLNRHKFRMWI